MNEVQSYTFSDNRKISCHLSENYRPIRCQIDGQELPTEQFQSNEQDPTLTSKNIEQNKIFVINTQITLRDAIKAKRISPFPLLVLNGKDTFAGIIRDEDIFSGILKDKNS